MTEFETLIKNNPGLIGLNVTVPYKQKVIPYLDALSKISRTIQAVNTINFCWRDGRLALIGHNSDVPGFERSIKEHLKEHHSSALVLGTGGASKAITYVLDKIGIEYQLVSRTEGKERITYGNLESDMVKKSSLIINTTPLGMHPDRETYPKIPYDAITSDHLLFDLVYNPEKTQFLSKGEEQGAAIVNGYKMLVYQAEESWKIWNKL